MKKLLILLCLVAALLTFPVYSEEYTHGIYKITFSENLISNDSVGNDWTVSYTCDEKPIADGETLTVPLNDPTTKVIDITITEKDKIPDIGRGSVSVTFNGESEINTIVTVTENGGRYQGNKAQWKIMCNAELIKKT